MDGFAHRSYQSVVEDIAGLAWTRLDAAELSAVAWAYYYFSIQFRENLATAAEMFPDDAKLQHLVSEECNTDNLSPWAGVAAPGEAMNHDEFMRRTLTLSPIDPAIQARVEQAGAAYLETVRAAAPMVQALSIASYEDRGLEATFRAMLTAPDWNTPLLGAFKHFLKAHILFDSDPEAGHGALSRHLAPDERVVPLWEAFRRLLIVSVPTLVA